MAQHTLYGLDVGSGADDRLYECGSYAKANDSTPDSSHLEKRPMHLPPIAIVEMRADKIRVNREHGGDPRRAHGMFLRAKLSAAFRLLEDPLSSEIMQEDWELAGMMMRYSRRCYEENLQEYRNENLKRRADYREEDELVREQVDMRSQLATEERIMEVLSNSPKPSVPKGELTAPCPKGRKPVWTPPWRT